MKPLFPYSIVLVSFGLSIMSCVPASVSRIGPPRTPREATCEIAVLPPGEVPNRPWVDIGAVFLENCQEYHVGLCRKWLTQRACELGGEVAYLPNPTPPKNEINNVNYRVLVAVYAVEAQQPISGAGCAEPKPETDSDTSVDENEMRCLE